LLVAPVVMISAGGLLCLALYNRLSGIISRVRTFSKERYETYVRLNEAEQHGTESQSLGYLRARGEVLDSQVAYSFRRARLIRGALGCMLSMVMCMLLCSLCLGGALLRPYFAPLALGFFFLGVLAMLASVGLAMVELRYALDPALLEYTETNEIDHEAILHG
jgi:hypothetical protein